MKRRTCRGGGGDRGYLWSPHGAKADLIGEMGRLDAKERMREREEEREWGSRPCGREGGEEARRSVAWKVAAGSRTFARETRRSAANFHSLKFALSGVGGGK